MKRRTLLLTTLVVAAVAAHAPVASATPPTTPTTTSLAATPTPVKTGAPVTYTVTVSPAPAGGTVAIYDEGVIVAGCGALALSNGTTTCATTASADAGLHVIHAMYGGSGLYEESEEVIHVRVNAQTTTVATASPKLADPGQKMTYTAVVTPRPEHGGIAACSGGCGNPTVETVDFFVDGAAVAGCATRSVAAETGVATCTAPAPTAGGAHALTASYSGSADDYLTASAGTDDFAVKAPALSVSAGSLAFGPVTVGAAGTHGVTVTNGGTGDLHVGALTVDGPFTANGCDGATLAPGASCVVTVAFRPAGLGAAAGTLTIGTDAGAQGVALAGTGVAAPTTTPPPTGATLPPNTSTTFTATTSNAGSSTVTVPLRCPNGVACTLDGTVVISTDDLVKSKTARAAAAETKTVARFAGVRVAAGKVKAIKLKLSPAFIKTAQKRGIRFIHAVLTVNTTFTDGSHATRQAQVTIRIPKAARKAVKKQAAVAPRFTG